MYSAIHLKELLLSLRDWKFDIVFLALHCLAIPWLFWWVFQKFTL